MVSGDKQPVAIESAFPRVRMKTKTIVIKKKIFISAKRMCQSYFKYYFKNMSLAIQVIFLYEFLTVPLEIDDWADIEAIC